MQRQSVGLSHWKVADVGNIFALAITSKWKVTLISRRHPDMSKLVMAASKPGGV